jgi:hypothetical protein
MKKNWKSSSAKKPKQKKQQPKNPMAGKGDKPRNCFSNQFKNNFDMIDWSKKKTKKSSNKKALKTLKRQTFVY